MRRNPDKPQTISASSFKRRLRWMEQIKQKQQRLINHDSFKNPLFNTPFCSLDNRRAKVGRTAALPPPPTFFFYVSPCWVHSKKKRNACVVAAAPGAGRRRFGLPWRPRGLFPTLTGPLGRGLISGSVTAANTKNCRNKFVFFSFQNFLHFNPTI